MSRWLLDVALGLSLLLCAVLLVSITRGMFWLGVVLACLSVLVGLWLMWTRRRMLLAIFVAVLASLIVVVVFASRPTRAEILAARIKTGATVAQAKTILGEPLGGVNPKGTPFPTAYVWAIEGDMVVVSTGGDEIVTSVAVRKVSLLERLRKLVEIH